MLTLKFQMKRKILDISKYIMSYKLFVSYPVNWDILLYITEGDAMAEHHTLLNILPTVKLNNVYSFLHIRHSQVNKHTTKHVNIWKQERQDSTPHNNNINQIVITNVCQGQGILSTGLNLYTNMIYTHPVYHKRSLIIDLICVRFFFIN